MSTATKLFEPTKLGPFTLPNRLVMAPLTRNRALPGLVPNPLAVEYYGQRASAGLLVSEATQVSQQGQGYQDTPGIYSKEQVAGWRKVTDRVHERGGRIFLQLWHVGRISHVELQENNQAPVAPSAIRAKGKTFVGGTFADVSEPRALTLEEIPGIIESFRKGAANALAAGFDGVEVHGANGYLLEQFAKDGTNKRTDAYGGGIENRAKLMLEVGESGGGGGRADRTGIRISPVTPANDISDSNPQPLYDYIVDHLSALKLVYIHVVEGATGGPRDIAPFDYGICASDSAAPISPTTAMISNWRTRCWRERSRPDRIRKAVHLQPRPGREVEARRAAERVGQGDVLRRRRQGIYGLSGAGRFAAGGAVIDVVIARRLRDEAIQSWCGSGLLRFARNDKRPGSLPAFRHSVIAGLDPASTCKKNAWMSRVKPGMTTLGRSVRRPLRRAGRPRFDQRVVVDGFALRLFVGELALRRQRAVLLNLGEPVFGGLLLVQLRAAGAFWTPDFSSRSITESCAAASASIAACGVFAPDDASPMFCHHSCASFG